MSCADSASRRQADYTGTCYLLQAPLPILSLICRSLTQSELLSVTRVNQCLCQAAQHPIAHSIGTDVGLDVELESHRSFLTDEIRSITPPFENVSDTFFSAPLIRSMRSLTINSHLPKNSLAHAMPSEFINKRVFNALTSKKNSVRLRSLNLIFGENVFAGSAEFDALARSSICQQLIRLHLTFSYRMMADFIMRAGLPSSVKLLQWTRVINQYDVSTTIPPGLVDLLAHPECSITHLLIDLPTSTGKAPLKSMTPVTTTKGDLIELAKLHNIERLERIEWKIDIPYATIKTYLNKDSAATKMDRFTAIRMSGLELGDATSDTKKDRELLIAVMKHFPSLTSLVLKKAIFANPECTTVAVKLKAVKESMKNFIKSYWPTALRSSLRALSISVHQTDTQLNYGQLVIDMLVAGKLMNMRKLELRLKMDTKTETKSVDLRELFRSMPLMTSLVIPTLTLLPEHVDTQFAHASKLAHLSMHWPRLWSTRDYFHLPLMKDDVKEEYELQYERENQPKRDKYGTIEEHYDPPRSAAAEVRKNSAAVLPSSLTHLHISSTVRGRGQTIPTHILRTLILPRITRLTWLRETTIYGRKNIEKRFGRVESARVKELVAKKEEAKKKKSEFFGLLLRQQQNQQ